MKTKKPRNQKNPGVRIIKKSKAAVITLPLRLTAHSYLAVIVRRLSILMLFATFRMKQVGVEVYLI